MTDHHPSAGDREPPACPPSPPAGSPAGDPYSAPLWNNPVTMVGVFIVVIGIILLLTFGLFSVISPAANPYVDIVGYMILPGILVTGLIVAPVGILLRSRKLKRLDPARRFRLGHLRIDLGDPRQRRAVKFFVAVTFIMLPVIGVSSYHGYHYTDSVQFCAQACHSVMKPEATAYHHGAHARVSCAECHIGEGASWFVKSKISGLRQVVATLRGNYSRPIPPAIQHLRPARETCERCHWPEKFYGAKLREIVDYASDESNTRRQINMLVNIGGGHAPSGHTGGIHYFHMSASGKVEYVATDDRLQVIPWVKWTDLSGRERIYRSDGRPGSEPPPDGNRRLLDCMDCHNRPAHAFRAPERSVDTYLEVGRIDRELPYIKREAVSALIQPYADETSAAAGISAALREFYSRNYPEVAAQRQAELDQAIAAVQEIHAHTFFPTMRVTWQTYPDNIGHMISPGCLRCHDGRHFDEQGAPISAGCDICHTFLNPAETASSASPPVLQQGSFVHPYALEGVHANLLCHQCHTGGRQPVTDCAGCHSDQQALITATAGLLAPFKVTASPMADIVECGDCHDLTQTMTLDRLDAACMGCHDDEPEKYTGMLAAWADAVGRARDQAQRAVAHIEVLLAKSDPAKHPAAREWVQRSRAILLFLDEAGSLHNPDASRAVFERLSAEAAETLKSLGGEADAAATP